MAKPNCTASSDVPNTTSIPAVGMRAVVLAVLSALVLAPPAADAFRGGGDCFDIPRLPSDRRGDGKGSSNRLTLATFDARWIATMSPVNATAKGEKQDKAMADRLRAEDRERYRAFGKLLAEIKADVVDVSGTNGCGALRQMLSAEVQLLPEHASKVRQYLHERPEDKGIAMRHTGMLTYVDPSASITRVDDARMAYPIPHTRCPADERDRADQSSSSCESEYSCPAAAADDDDASSCAADAARSCDAARTAGVTGPPKDHYVTRMAVGNKNVTLLVVHFDEPDWSCARREAAATIVANEAARTRRGGLGFTGRAAGTTADDDEDDDDDDAGDASGGRVVVVVVRRQDAGGRPRGHRQASPGGLGLGRGAAPDGRGRRGGRAGAQGHRARVVRAGRLRRSAGRRRRRRGARSAEEEQDLRGVPVQDARGVDHVGDGSRGSDAGERKAGHGSPAGR